jgi:hypothetical protein
MPSSERRERGAYVGEVAWLVFELLEGGVGRHAPDPVAFEGGTDLAPIGLELGPIQDLLTHIDEVRRHAPSPLEVSRGKIYAFQVV